MASTEAPALAEVREGTYDDKATTIEPGGAGFIPLEERHGKPSTLFWTWLSPNLEFATVFLGILAVAGFGLSFWQAVAAIVIGNVIGSGFHYILSAQGPKLGVPQMISSRIAFGYRGNILPAGLNSFLAGTGWFAVNSVTGALALSVLIGVTPLVALLIVVAVQILIAVFGYNFIHSYEKLISPLLLVAFVLAGYYVFTQFDISVLSGSPTVAPEGDGAQFWVHPIAGMTLTAAAVFGYASGWNAFAADYTRYLPADGDAGHKAGLWAAAGLFVSMTTLAIMGAAAMGLAEVDPFGNPVEAFVANMPSLVGSVVLLAIVLGSIGANVLNVYSGSLSFLAMGIKIRAERARALVAAIFGIAGTAAALYGLNNLSEVKNFLLVIAYWVAAWLGVVFADMIARKGTDTSALMFDQAHSPKAGWVSMVVALVVSIPLFSNQLKYVGPMPETFVWLGDVTPFVGFAVAFGLYLLIFRRENRTVTVD